MNQCLKLKKGSMEIFLVDVINYQFLHDINTSMHLIDHIGVKAK